MEGAFILAAGVREDTSAAQGAAGLIASGGPAKFKGTFVGQLDMGYRRLVFIHD